MHPKLMAAMLAASESTGGGGGGGGFPTTGLLAWYKADAGITKDGSDKVSQWNDQSGNARHLMQGTGIRQPTWVASVVNGQPGVLFPSGTGIAIPSGVSAVAAMLFVWKYPTATFSNLSVIISGAGAGSHGLYGQIGTTGFASFPPHAAAQVDGVSSAGPISPLNAAHWQYIEPSPARTYVGELLGNWPVVFDNNWTGHICEAAFWSAALSAPDLTSLDGYVASRYAI